MTKKNILLSIKLSLLLTIFSISVLLTFPQQQTEDVKTMTLNIGEVTIAGNIATISGIIKDDKGMPLTIGVAVSLKDSKGNSLPIFIDDSGNFQIHLDKEHFPMRRVELTVELNSFTKPKRIIVDLPWPPSQSKEDKTTTTSEKPQEQCKTSYVTLSNGQGLIFKSGDIVEENEADIHFKENKLYTRRGKGGIASVGNQGNRSLCDVNYPPDGYCDCSLIGGNHVYIYESYHDDIHAEIRIKSFKPGEKVEIVYHVRKE